MESFEATHGPVLFNEARSETEEHYHEEEKKEFQSPAEAEPLPVLADFFRTEYNAVTIEDAERHFREHVASNSATPVLYNAMFKTYWLSNEFESAELVYEGMRESKIQIDQETYTSMVIYYGRKHKIDLIEKIYHELRLEDVMPDVGFYNALLVGLSRVTRPSERMMVVYDEMRKANVRPDEKTYCIIMEMYGRMKDYEMVERTFEEMIEAGLAPDFTVYSRVILLYVRAKMPRQATRKFQHMVAAGIQADTFLYNAFIGMFNKIQDVDAAEDVYNEMGEKGVERNMDTYDMMLDLYGKTKSYSFGERVFKDMLAAGIPEDEHFFSKRIVLYSALREIRLAEMNFAKMKNEGYTPTETAYVAMIDLYSNVRDITAAENIFDELRNNTNDHKVLLAGYSSMLHLFRRHEMYKKAGDLFEQAHTTGVADTELFNVMIHIWRKNNRFDRACAAFSRLRQSGMKPNATTYNTMLLLHCRNNNPPSIVELLQEMRLEGVRVEQISYKSIIELYKNRKEYRNAEMTFQAMKDDGVENIASYSLLMNMYQEARMYVQEKAVYKELRASHLHKQNRKRAEKAMAGHKK